jgi:hypothetical protein
MTPLLLTWLANNMVGHVKRAVSTAALLSFANLGGIAASYAFQSKDEPRYLTGYTALVSVLVVTWCLTWVYFLGLRWENKKRDQGKLEYLRAVASEQELADLHVFLCKSVTDGSLISGIHCDWRLHLEAYRAAVQCVLIILSIG